MGKKIWPLSKLDIDLVFKFLAGAGPGVSVSCWAWAYCPYCSGTVVALGQ